MTVGSCYIYALFDFYGIIKYVGKGTGNRWKAHQSDPRAYKTFVTETIARLGEVPMVKIRENLTTIDALRLEEALIKAIGMYPVGPLVNKTTKGSGPNSRQVRKWWANRTPEERRAIALKGRATWRAKRTPEEISEEGRKRALSVGRSVLSERMRKWKASLTREEASRLGREAGLASAASTSLASKQERGRKGIASYMANTTSTQRKENAKRTGVAKLTKEQLSINGTKGVKTLNASKTPEERTAQARKAALAGHRKRALLKLPNYVLDH
jgi:hypothetical protein